MTTPDYGPSAAQVARMRAKIAGAIELRARRRRRRAHATVVATAVVLTVGVTAGTLVTNIPRELVGGAYFCFTADDQLADYAAYSHILDEEPPTDTATLVSLSLEYCALAAEEQGFVAPHPTVCRFFDGRLAVFPNVEGRRADEFCAYVGLPTP